MGFSVAQRNAALTAAANGVTYAAAFVGGTEVVGNNYSRVIVNNIGGASPAWTTPAQDATNAAYQRTHNDAQFSFPTPTASWGTVDEIRIMDNSTGGALVCDCPIPSAEQVEITASRPLTVKVNGLAMRIDNEDSAL